MAAGFPRLLAPLFFPLCRLSSPGGVLIGGLSWLLCGGLVKLPSLVLNYYLSPWNPDASLSRHPVFCCYLTFKND